MPATRPNTALRVMKADCNASVADNLLIGLRLVICLHGLCRRSILILRAWSCASSISQTTSKKQVLLHSWSSSLEEAEGPLCRLHAEELGDEVAGIRVELKPSAVWARLGQPSVTI